MQKEIQYGIIGLLAGILIGIFSVSQAVNNNMTGMMGMMGMRFGSNGITGINMMNSAESIDAHFIEQMIPHHEDAITMANLALINAKRPEIKQLSQNIIDSQSKEINDMREWYKDWYGGEVPQDEQVMGGHGMGGNNGMHMGMMGDETDMTRLEQSADFDRAFIEEMIPHHQMAVMMANMLKNGNNRPEMQRLADDIINAQTAEISQMRSWYSEWYNI